MCRDWRVAGMIDGAEIPHQHQPPRVRACVTNQSECGINPMVRSLSVNVNIPGTIFKLESPQGTILGTIKIPQDWADLLCRCGYVEFCIAPPVSVKSYESVSITKSWFATAG